MEEENYFLNKDRMSVFIGSNGETKKELEKKFDSKIDVNSETGEVFAKSENSINLFILGHVVNAINYGHNPKNAMLLEDENFVFDIIDIKTLVRDHTRLKIVLGRIIGKGGQTRKLIEEITKCNIAIKDSFVTIVGPYENSILVHEALDMLIGGASHKSFYAYLEKNKSADISGLFL